jgi:hypothetical protein
MKPHVLYITPMFGYPPMAARGCARTTPAGAARCADVSPSDAAAGYARPRGDGGALATAFLRRTVVMPRSATASRQAGLVRSLVRAVVPESARAAIRSRRSAAPQTEEAPAGRDPAQLEAIVEYIRDRRPDVMWLGFAGISYDLVPLKERTGLPLVLETECIWSRFILRELPFETDPARRAAIEREGVAKEAEERFGGLHTDITTAVSDVDGYFASHQAPTADADANAIDVDAYHRSWTGLQPPALVWFLARHRERRRHGSPSTTSCRASGCADHAHLYPGFNSAPRCCPQEPTRNHHREVASVVPSCAVGFATLARCAQSDSLKILKRCVRAPGHPTIARR